MAEADFRPQRPIALVGLMGVGKSTVGAALAARLGIPFSDVDDEVERAAGMSVAELFERFGEEAFRDREVEALARVLTGSVRVIATGGGALLRDETRRRLLAASTMIWLDAPIDTLIRRIGDETDRPLLRGEDLRCLLARLAEERRPFYAQASLRLSAEPPIEDVVESALAALALRA